LYADSDIILFDDPLSALDAHVGEFVFQEAILGLQRLGKTVVLVTHALHMLGGDVDYI
jgi:ATP-binding cassette, subfamily C (CFTR/MRP), member 1